MYVSEEAKESQEEAWQLIQSPRPSAARRECSENEDSRDDYLLATEDIAEFSPSDHEACAGR